MSEHHATIDWKRETPDFAYETYNRDHDWTFDAGVTVRGSAAPAYKGSESCVDPEEAFVASLSSCHMLTFLALAARKRYYVGTQNAHFQFSEIVLICVAGWLGRSGMSCPSLCPMRGSCLTRSFRHCDYGPFAAAS
jgi:hypothetical protein